MVFGEVISIVVSAFFPVYFELLLGLAVSEPVVSHVPRFGSFLVNIVVYESRSSGVVRFQGCWRLWVIQCF